MLCFFLCGQIVLQLLRYIQAVSQCLSANIISITSFMNLNLIEFLLKASWVNVLAAAIVGSISGIGSAASIALINQSISQVTPAHPQTPQELMWGFMGLVAISFSNFDFTHCPHFNPAPLMQLAEDVT